MSFRMTGVLLVVLLALGAFVYFYEMQTPKTKEDPKQKALEILNYSGRSADIVSLEVKQGDKVTRLVSTGDGGWKLEAPQQAPADIGRAITAVGEMTVLKGTTLVTENADDVAKYGLDKPEFTATLGLKNDEAKTLLVGMEAPTKIGHYVKLADDNRILLLSSTVTDDLQKLVTEPPIATPTPTPFSTLTPTPETSATPTP